ncbi:hypothetical protein GNF76_13250 [Pseudomonas sp. CCM 7893]|uniref:Uncharacterized protein n=1 Tax=Pseudomonas spelaei TaxID=1055469 RepID=A0A6I3WD99_9PSED|nr:hypothetical protein [Pseudomonas spelaei]MUF05313.1 hypothetical protein [Pseudomonas spelaei]
MSIDHDCFNCGAGQDFLSLRMTRALSAVLQERNQQIGPKGYAVPLEDQHIHGEIAQAAADFLTPAQILAAKNSWAVHKAEHPRRRQLVIGAALALAEIERIDRLSLMPGEPVGITPSPLTEENRTDKLQDLMREELHMLRASHDHELCRRVALDQQLVELVRKVIHAVKTGSLPTDLTELEAWLFQKVDSDE